MPGTVMDRYGAVVHAGMVADAIRTTVAAWMPTYLQMAARLDGRLAGAGPAGQTMPSYRSYVDAVDPGRFPEDQMPALVIVVPGVTGAPKKQGRGTYRATFAVGLGCVVSGPDRPNTVRLAELYTMATRLIMVQKSALRGDPAANLPPFASGVVWVGERYGMLRFDDSRSIVGGQLQFTVDIDGAADVSQGPDVPVPDGSDPGPWNTVGSATMTVTGEEIT